MGTQVDMHACTDACTLSDKGVGLNEVLLGHTHTVETIGSV